MMRIHFYMRGYICLWWSISIYIYIYIYIYICIYICIYIFGATIIGALRCAASAKPVARNASRLQILQFCGCE